MAGPGSRLEKAGTIFSRVRGLLRSGALKESEKPLWYDVYAAYPPRVEQAYDRQAPDTEPISILYKEDLVRAKFYKTYGNPSIIDMNGSSLSLSQKFIDKYFEVQKSEQPNRSTIFEAVAEALKREGIRLKSLEEIAEEKQAAVANRIKEATSQRSDPVWSGQVQPEEAEDTLDEALEQPDYDQIMKNEQPK